MDPVTLIVGALAAGALKGAGETAGTAVKDAYGALRRLIASRFAGRPAAELALAEHESDPNAYQAPLAKHVRESGLAQDGAVVSAAQELMALLDADGSRAGKYVVAVHDAQGVQIGDRNTQSNVFNGPPAK
jgi:hypothetical protein